jgi:hypothetical protein
MSALGHERTFVVVPEKIAEQAWRCHRSSVKRALVHLLRAAFAAGTAGIAAANR